MTESENEALENTPTSAEASETAAASENADPEKEAETILSQMNGTALETVTDVPVEVVRIYTPESDDDWYYNHAAFITEFKGRYYAFWHSSPVNEEDVGQRIMMAVSDNFYDWEVSVLQDTVMGWSTEMTLICAGCYVHDETLTVYVWNKEYSKTGLRKNEDGTDLRPLVGKGDVSQSYSSYLQTQDGVNWTPMTRMSNVTKINLSPVVLSSGRLFWCCAENYAYTDDPSGINGWVERAVSTRVGSGTQWVAEASVFETDEGRICMLFRAADGSGASKGQKRYGAISEDGGDSFSRIYETGFDETDSKFEMGRLPDGRYFLVGNTDTGRSSLVLMTSENGIDFNKHYVLNDKAYTVLKQGYCKGNFGYSYPTVHIDDEYMYVIYTLGKESTEILRVRLTDLD